MTLKNIQTNKQKPLPWQYSTRKTFTGTSRKIMNNK